jgi:hypothetical protein
MTMKKLTEKQKEELIRAQEAVIKAHSELIATINRFLWDPEGPK